MLSVTPISSAQGAADYYGKASEYYMNDSAALQWQGKSAAMLGLTGLIEKKDLLALLNGILPTGEELHKRKAEADIDGKKSAERRPGFDMTFSAPKSVSLLVGLGAAPELQDAHDRAVSKALVYIEKNFAETRIVKDNAMRFLKTDNLCFATFRQMLSRANDPDLHTHCITMNMTFAEEKFRALSSDTTRNYGVLEQIMYSAHHAGLVYRYELFNSIKEMGFELRETQEGLYEIDGIEPAILEAFSTRRQEIEANLEKRGDFSAKEASLAAIRTRPQKDEPSPDEARALWQEQAADLGFDAKAFVEQARAAKTQNLTEEQQGRNEPGYFSRFKERVMTQFFGLSRYEERTDEKAVEVAIEKISQKMSAFEYKDILDGAMKHAVLGKEVVSFERLERAIQNKIEKGDLYQGECPVSSKNFYTTPWLLTQESETLARIERNKQSVSAIASTHQTQLFITQYEKKSPYPLTASQKQGLLSLFNCQDRFIAIQGYAGTGKTTMMHLTRELAEKNGYNLMGLAVTASAARELSHKAGIASDVFQVVHARVKHLSPEVAKKTLVILDEASLISSAQGHALIRDIERVGARLCLVGDDAQLPTVKNGRIFGLTQDFGIQTSEMRDIIRQQNTRLKEAVHHAINRDVYDALSKLDGIIESDQRDERITAVAERYLNFDKGERDNVLIFAPRHTDRQSISEAIRGRLQTLGELRGEAHRLLRLTPRNLEEIQTHFSRYYKAGDVIRFNIDIKKHGIQSGDYLRVINIGKEERSKNTILLQNEAGKSLSFALDLLPKYKSTEAGMQRSIEVYSQSTIELQEGDKITWTRNFKHLGVFNSEASRVHAIADKTILLERADKSVFEVSRDDKALQHIDYGYVLTTMKAQGKDKMHAIGLMESGSRFAANLNHFYVQISRGIQSVTLVTNDKEKLLASLEKNTERKVSAVDYVSSAQITAHDSRFKDHPRHVPQQAVVDWQARREQRIQAVHALLEKFNAAHLSGNRFVAAQTAHALIRDRSQLALAKTKLLYNEKTYRDCAMPIERLRLYKSLDTDAKHDFRQVARYVNLAKSTQEAWKLYFESKHDGYKNRAEGFSLERNALASELSKNISRYKPMLAHFSIGEANRFGLPQTAFTKANQFAEQRLAKLAEHAKSHAVREFALAYIQNESRRPDIARTLLEHRRQVLPLFEEGFKEQARMEWHRIERAGRDAKDTLVRGNLGQDSQALFDVCKDYREQGIEAGILWAQGEAGQSKLGDLHLSRQSSAKRILEQQTHPDFGKITQYFKLNTETLVRQGNRALMHETVMRLKQNGNFQERLAAARTIQNDIGSFYPLIKEQGVDAKNLSRLLHYVALQTQKESLNDKERMQFKQESCYRVRAKQCARAWQAYQAHKTDRGRLEHALEITAKRDALAYGLVGKTLLRADVSIEKVHAHAQKHQERLNEIQQKQQHQERLAVAILKASQTNPKSKAILLRDAEKTSSEAKWMETSPLYQEARRSTNGIVMDKQALLREVLQAKARPALSSQKPSITREDITAITESLIAHPEQTYRAIFGEPKKQTSREMRYDGGLIVSLKGAKAGYWYNFSEAKGGSPIQALMQERGLGFKEALQEAKLLAGYAEPLPFLSARASKADTIAIASLEEQAKITSAISMLKASIPLKNTLAERYLKEHRGVESTKDLKLRYLPPGVEIKTHLGEGKLEPKINKSPMLILETRNAKGDITGVQRIYLDGKTANKNTLMTNPKLSLGNMKGSAGVLQTGVKGGRVYLAEGIETGASIANADPKATVLISFGVSNLANLADKCKTFFPREVIIAGDNDIASGNKTQQTTALAEKTLQDKGLPVRTISPLKIPGMDKTDWNDVHKKMGLEEVKNQLGIDRSIGVKSGLLIESQAMHIDNRQAQYQQNYAQILAQKQMDFGKTLRDIERQHIRPEPITPVREHSQRPVITREMEKEISL